MARKELKILFITHYASLYGANRSLLQLVIELKQKYGVIPFVLLPCEGELAEALKINGIKYIVSRFYPWVYVNNVKNFLRSCFFYAWNLFLYRKIYIQIKASNIDLIHTNSSVVALGAVLRFFLKKPHVWHLREYGRADYNLKYIGGKCLSSKVYNTGAEVFIAISKSVKDYYSSFIEPSKIRVIYNGIEQIPLSSYPKGSRPQVAFCCVGFVYGPKNQMLILKAADELIRHYQTTDFTITFIGDIDEKYGKSLYRYIASTGLAPYIRWEGYKKEVDSFLQRMDVGIMSSRQEAFGRVTVEYMLNSMPVLATDSGANAEITVEGETGFLVPREDYRLLACRMRRLIEDRELLRRLGEEGRKRAMQRFTSSKNTEAVYKLYGELIN